MQSVLQGMDLEIKGRTGVAGARNSGNIGPRMPAVFYCQIAIFPAVKLPFER